MAAVLDHGPGRDCGRLSLHDITKRGAPATCRGSLCAVLSPSSMGMRVVRGSSGGGGRGSGVHLEWKLVDVGQVKDPGSLVEPAGPARPDLGKLARLVPGILTETNAQLTVDRARRRFARAKVTPGGTPRRAAARTHGSPSVFQPNLSYRLYWRA